MYIAIFEYTFPAGTEPDMLALFEAYYGSQGPWVQLFNQSPGFLGTGLFRVESGDTSVYVTIDSWQSQDDYQAFLIQQREQYECTGAAAQSTFGFSERWIARARLVG